MPELPLLGLLVDGAPEPAVMPLLVELRRWCRPASYTSHLEGVGAWLAMSPSVAVPDDRPLAVWVSDEAALNTYPADTVSRARAVLCPVTAVATASPPTIEVPASTPGQLGSTPVLTPFVRRRWRRRFGLPDELTVVLSPDGAATANGVAIPPDLLATTLRLASVVVAPDDRPIEALASGAPCVADEEEARAVLADDREAASLSYRARRLVEARHDLVHVARRVARVLDLEGPHDPVERIALRLDELETPTASRVRDRLADAIAGLVGAAG